MKGSLNRRAATNMERILQARSPYAALQVCPESVPARLARSRELERAGKYDEAREVLGELWGGPGHRPRSDALGEATAAELLLCAGMIAGRIGSAKQSGDVAASAKDMVSESAVKFDALGDDVRAAEAMIELGHCYWREAAYDEARIVLREALGRLGQKEPELRALALSRLAVVERCAGRYPDAHRILEECRPLLDETDSHFLKGNFFNTHALVLKHLGMIDRALIAYSEASFHFEEAGHARYCARVENNLAMLFLQLGRYEKAHEHLDRARGLFDGLRDAGSVAQVDETTSRVLIEQRRYNAALRIIRGVVATLERGGELGLLSEALTTQGVALARAGYREQARGSLDRALSVAEEASDCEGAGRAALTVIEELGEQTPALEIARLYEHASSLLQKTQDALTLERVRVCSLAVVHRLSAAHPHPKQVRGTVYQFPKTLARVETFTIHVPDDSLEETGIPQDAPVKFRLTREWDDGDLVFVMTPKGNFIVYVYKESAGTVRMEGAHSDCPARRFSDSEIIVFGVAITQ